MEIGFFLPGGIITTTRSDKHSAFFPTPENGSEDAQAVTNPGFIMDNERNIRRTILPNGLTILTEKMDHIRSVAMGVWIRAGSRHEMAEVNGISHFVEHMVFKGTKSRSAQRIAREVDAIGGNLDAFTGKETVCFNIKVLDEHVP